MGALVLLSDFTEKDNVNLKRKMRELFLDKKYTLSYIPSMTDRELKYFERTKNKLSEYGNFEFNYFDIDDFCSIDKIEKIFKSDVYNHCDDKDTWFLRVKELSEKLGYAKNAKNYKKNPELYKGVISDVATVIRVALANRTQTQDLYEIMQVMGEKRVIERLSQDFI